MFCGSFHETPNSRPIFITLTANSVYKFKKSENFKNIVTLHSGSDLRRAIALARHRAPKCCTRRVIFSAPWSTHKQTRSKESDFSLSYSSLCPPKESDLSLSCHFQNLSTDCNICIYIYSDGRHCLASAHT